MITKISDHLAMIIVLSDVASTCPKAFQFRRILVKFRKQIAHENWKICTMLTILVLTFGINQRFLEFRRQISMTKIGLYTLIFMSIRHRKINVLKRLQKKYKHHLLAR